MINLLWPSDAISQVLTQIPVANGNTDLGQHQLTQWLVAKWQQAIIWTNVDLSSDNFTRDASATTH